jgi:type I site-specific restriction endonuclease
MDEKRTRQEIIDRDLWLARWNVKDPSQVTEELDIDLSAAGQRKVAESRTPYGGHQFADYALLMGSKPVAVLEAKKTSKDAELGQEQGLQYAQNLQKIHNGALPFVMYSNGYDSYFWESDFYPPVKIHGFPTREDMQWLAQRRDTRKPLSVELINTDIAGRDYQHDPTFAYTYEEVTSHTPPYLCDFEVLKVRSKFQLEGIKGGTLTEPHQRQRIQSLAGGAAGSMPNISKAKLKTVELIRPLQIFSANLPPSSRASKSRRPRCNATPLNPTHYPPPSNPAPSRGGCDDRQPKRDTPHRKVV